MSENNALGISPNRVLAADAIRKLGHAFVAHDIDDKLLGAMAKAIDEILPRVEASPKRSRAVDAMKRAAFSSVPEDGETTEHFPDCIVSGKANPMGVAATGFRDGDEAVVKVVLGAAFEGAPGRAHGGIVAALFDDTMGFVLSILATPAYTGRLSVNYKKPTPVGEEIEFRGRCISREGRKIAMTAEASCNGDIFADAEALFITVPSHKFVTGT